MDISTKADIGDIVFFMANNKVQYSEVRYIKIEITEESNAFSIVTKISTTYHTASTDRLDSTQVFLSKQQLLDSL